MKTCWKFIGACGMVISSLGNDALAQATEKLVLRVADSFPVSGHWMVESATKPWMEEVTRLTNGAVTFQYCPADPGGGWH